MEYDNYRVMLYISESRMQNYYKELSMGNIEQRRVDSIPQHHVYNNSQNQNNRGGYRGSNNCPVIIV